MENQIEEITHNEQAAIDALRDRGYCVIVWTPEEIGDADKGTLEDVCISRGSDYLEQINGTPEEDEDE